MNIVSKRKNISLFLLLLVVITTLNGVGMGLASYFDKTVSIFSFIQMMIPATVTFLVFLILSDKSIPFPKYVCRAVFLTDILAIIWAVLEGLFLSPSLSESGNFIILILGTASLYLATFFESADVRERYGFSCKNSLKNIKHIFGYLFLFIVLYTVFSFVQVLFDYFGGNHSILMAFVEEYSHFPPELFFILFFFAIVSLPYFGEEYGWRGFLQPWLQKRFGMKKGIILTGVVWGIWHLPMFFDAYQFSFRFSVLVPVIIGKIAFCISIGIFIGYVYLKTKNIWICVIIHYLNNGMNQLIDPSTGEASLNFLLEIAVLIFAALLVYAPFIHSKVFRDKKIIDDFLLPRNLPESPQNELEQEDSK